MRLDALSIIEILCLALVFTGYWRIYEKAGKPGWAAVVPVYNVVVLLQIVEKPLWWAVFFFIPLINIVFSLIVHVELAERFGKGPLFGLGMTFFPVIFVPILGFGEAQYTGKQGWENGNV